MSQSSPMNAGDGTYSYAKNSTVQRDAASGLKDVINETVIENLDVEKLLSGSTTFAIADLGCSVGPNTFLAMESLIQTVGQKYHEQGLDPQNLEFQIFFNDQIGNDFNTLFATLPHRRNYFAAGVPGSFYGRLFPPSSVHVAYSSYTIHWLSKVPEEVQRKDSPAWNAGKIHYTGASDAVVKAYARQFEEDMETFLRARAQEIVPGGMIVIIAPAVPDGVVEYGTGIAFTYFEAVLADMVKEGVVEQEQVDSFNIGHLYPCVKDMRRLVEKNGCFEIVKMELGKLEVGELDDEVTESVIMHIRALLEGTMANHFGNQITHQLFVRVMQQKLNFARHLHSSGTGGSAARLFAALKRKSYISITS